MSISIEIDVSDVEHEWGSTVSKIGSGMRSAVAASTRAGERVAEAHAPHRTYQLRNKIEGRVTSSDANSATGEIEAAAKHSSFVADGTPPHEITAHGRALAFNVNGQTVFRKTVHHPGTKPNDFWKLGELAAGLVLEQKANEVVDAACESMNGSGG